MSLSVRTTTGWPLIRNVVLFVAGLAGIGFETIARRPPDYGLLPIFAGMVGLPWFVSQDERKSEQREESQHPHPYPTTHRDVEG